MHAASGRDYLGAQPVVASGAERDRNDCRHAKSVQFGQLARRVARGARGQTHGRGAARKAPATSPRPFSCRRIKETQKRRKFEQMKRSASGEPEEFLQPSEKATKEGDAGLELVRTDPLLELLKGWTPAEAAALRWQEALQRRDVLSLDFLKRLARDAGWEMFLKNLCDSHEVVLASKLNIWKQGLGPLGPSKSFGGNSQGALVAQTLFFFSLSFITFTSGLISAIKAVGGAGGSERCYTFAVAPISTA